MRRLAHGGRRGDSASSCNLTLQLAIATGVSIDTDEAVPGPIMLQGEETRVVFRNITITVPRTY